MHQIAVKAVNADMFVLCWCNCVAAEGLAKSMALLGIGTESGGGIGGDSFKGMFVGLSASSEYLVATGTAAPAARTSGVDE